MANTSIVVEFKGGGFVVVTDPRLLEIFMSRWDSSKIEYIIYDGQHIEGHLVTAIRGDMATGRMRYI